MKSKLDFMDNPYYERLVNAALRLVSFRPRSEKELNDFLKGKLKKWKVVGEPLVKKAVDRMRELGYVDDRKFTEWWIEQRNAFRPRGKRALQFELKRKGISGTFVFDEFAAAKKAIVKMKPQQEVYAFLAARGFSSDTIEGMS